MERSSRGCGEKRIIHGENKRRPENWKEFLCSHENKEQVIRSILKVWGNDDCSEKLKDKDVIIICDGNLRLTV
jgi:hypothetical protein